MVQKEIIRSSGSHYFRPRFLVAKCDSDFLPDLDYRQLNQKIIVSRSFSLNCNQPVIGLCVRVVCFPGFKFSLPPDPRYRLSPLSTAMLCRTGHQFWNETLGKCVDCTKCTQTGDLVLRACQIQKGHSLRTFGFIRYLYVLTGQIPQATSVISALFFKNNEHTDDKEKPSV